MDWREYPSLLPFEKLFLTHSGPSPEEAVALRSLRDQLRSESFPIRQQIVQLQARESFLLRQLTLLETLLSIAQSLPQDVSQEIFRHLSPLTDLPQVAAVCRSWRDATHAFPQLWSTLTISDADHPDPNYSINDRLERCIGLASQVPLALTIDLERFVPALGTAGRLGQLILNMKSRSQWRSIEVTGRELDVLFPRFFSATDLQNGRTMPCSGGWTQLRSLHLQDAPIATSRARKPIEASITTMPSLTSLFIFMSEDHPISNIQAPWAQLQSLCLKLAPPESDGEVFDLSIYLHILKECANLVECALTVKCGQETILTSDTLVELPKLLRFELRAWNLPDKFFSKFKTPNLEELGLCVDADIALDDQRAFIPQYIAGFGSQLRKLFLSTPWDVKYLLPSLSSLVNLVELNLTFQKYPIHPFLGWITFDANKNIFNLPKLKTLHVYTNLAAKTGWDAFAAAMHSRIEIPLATHTILGQTRLPPPATLTSATLFDYTPLRNVSIPKRDQGVQYVYITSGRDIISEETLNPAHIGRFGMPCPRTNIQTHRVGRSNLTPHDLDIYLPPRLHH